MNIIGGTGHKDDNCTMGWAFCRGVELCYRVSSGLKENSLVSVAVRHNWVRIGTETGLDAGPDEWELFPVQVQQVLTVAMSSRPGFPHA